MYTVLRRKDKHNVGWFTRGAGGNFGSYDQNIYEVVELEALPNNWEDEKPILSGKDVEKYLRAGFKDRTFAERKALMQSIEPDLVVIRDDDELTEAEFNEAKMSIKAAVDGLLTSEQINALEAALIEYINTNFRFGGS